MQETQEMQVQSLGQEDPLEKEVTLHSSTLAWEISWTEDFPGKNTAVGYCFLLQGIFLTQGLNLHLLCLLHWQADSLPLCNLGSPLECFISVRYLKQI